MIREFIKQWNNSTKPDNFRSCANNSEYFYLIFHFYISKINLEYPTNVVKAWSTGFYNPWYAVDVSGYLYVTNAGNQSVAKISLADAEYSSTRTTTFFPK